MNPLVKIPRMERDEYDHLLRENHLSRIAFTNENRTYIAPFLYAFDGKHLYFLPSRYGKKMEFFKQNPHVSVEVEDVAADMSRYRFVTLTGHLEEVTKPEEMQRVKEMFASMIESGRLSENALSALGIDPAKTAKEILNPNRTPVWELKGVSEITALKDSV